MHEAFAKQFKKLRLSHNLTQRQLAEEFNRRYDRAFTEATICMYETGKRAPELETLINWAEFFSVSLDCLLGLNTTKRQERCFPNPFPLNEVLRVLRMFVAYLRRDVPLDLVCHTYRMRDNTVELDIDYGREWNALALETAINILSKEVI